MLQKSEGKKSQLPWNHPQARRLERRGPCRHPHPRLLSRSGPLLAVAAPLPGWPRPTPRGWGPLAQLRAQPNAARARGVLRGHGVATGLKPTRGVQIFKGPRKGTAPPCGRTVCFCAVDTVSRPRPPGRRGTARRCKGKPWAEQGRGHHARVCSGARLLVARPRPGWLARTRVCARARVCSGRRCDWTPGRRWGASCVLRPRQ